MLWIFFVHCIGTDMTVVIMLLTVSLSVTILLRTIHGRSSFLHTVEDHYLVGHVRDRQKVSSVLSCARLCLKRWPLCRSVNYGKKEGSRICELNDEGIESADTGVASLNLCLDLSLLNCVMPRCVKLEIIFN